MVGMSWGPGVYTIYLLILDFNELVCMEMVCNIF